SPRQVTGAVKPVPYSLQVWSVSWPTQEATPGLQIRSAQAPAAASQTWPSGQVICLVPKQSHRSSVVVSTQVAGLVQSQALHVPGAGSHSVPCGHGSSAQAPSLQTWWAAPTQRSLTRQDELVVGVS